jgi:hypothetical protein
MYDMLQPSENEKHKENLIFNITFRHFAASHSIRSRLRLTPIAKPIYGGGQTCTSYNFTINKLVQIPGKGGGNFVDNLSINDPRFSPSQTINYQNYCYQYRQPILFQRLIYRYFPHHTLILSQEPEVLIQTLKHFTFTINNLGAGQSQTFNLQGQTANSNTVPLALPV